MSDNKIVVRIAVRPVMSKCRLCGCRNVAGAKIYKVWVPGASKYQAGFYCDFCFDMLRRNAAELVPELKDEDTKKERAQMFLRLMGLRSAGPAPKENTQSVMPFDGSFSEITVEVPEYLIKDGDLFSLFYPEDEIDRGLHRQQSMRHHGRTW